ncbi:hypothetical protein SAMN06265795_102542 [Noviherbaspirillum humi]|uniref:Zinc-ribbon domain-containing protein n=1 Tax=Noviherbaspirillum humi TaxID=1688639 RepID=A0A239E687_9BURK|nr:putative zinc-binding peptidase [Noviherbaspirillum humi]SNS39969.1 hypothetical protein SAMN06265795_102542 [Noviherbaspirillum humi]
MRTFHCDKCGQQVFFENTRCENCGGMLGYQPEHRAISTFEPVEGGLWRSLNQANEGMLYKQCRNYAEQDVCNWMLGAQEHSELCASCQLTHVIPALTSPKNHLFWQRLEAAKRRLLYSLWDLQLQPTPKADDPQQGLAFEFLEDLPNGPRVLTGHANGVITLNIAEADPATRERVREQMHEPYRTLLGHFRHESGHYYFDRLITGTPWEEKFRALFGDERQDYAESLNRHYEQGPPADWALNYISAYATMHPWEDWAETWAHFLHMFDTLDTAFACGMMLKPRKPQEPEMAITTPPTRNTAFDDMLSDWFALSYVLNSLNRSVGMPDPYPFTLSTPVIDKLRFVHEVVFAYKQAAVA